MTILGLLSEFLGSLGEAATWSAKNIGTPILAGAVAGLAVPLAFRWERTPAEVRQHNREVADLNEDLRRFMSDLSRQVEKAIRACLSEKRAAEIKANIERDGKADHERPLYERLNEVGNQVRWERESSAAMFDALWRYRDEVLRKRGRFLQIVEAETARHKHYRGRKGCGYPVLRLPDQARGALGSWRRRPNPFTEESDDLHVEEDVTALELALLPLETDDGLTWKAAQKAILMADKQRPTME